MYGGHITDDWDRRLCKTYLVEYLKTELVEGIYDNSQLYFQYIRFIKSISKYNFFYKTLFVNSLLVTSCNNQNFSILKRNMLYINVVALEMHIILCYLMITICFLLLFCIYLRCW